MKVTLLSNARTSGGAAIAADRLNTALRQANVVSEIWTRETEAVAAGSKTLGIGAAWGLNRLRSPMVSKPFRWSGLARASRETESLNLLPSRIAPALNRSDTDVVNVHWIHRETMSLRDLSAITKPVVLTLHDMWWLLGTQHYREDEPGAPVPWVPSAPGQPADLVACTAPGNWSRLDEWMLRRKTRLLPKRLLVTTPSQWLSAQARQSRVFRQRWVETVPNALPLSVFRPASVEARQQLKRRFNFPLHKAIISFGAFNVADDARKGSRELAQALQLLAGTPTATRAHLAIFGGPVPSIIGQLGFSVSAVGAIPNALAMAEFLNAVDISVVPSRQENLPQTATEAVACGCPVIGFDVTGMADAVQHGLTGLLAPAYDERALAGLIARLVDADRSLMREQGPAHAQAHWAEQVVAARFAALFRTLSAQASHTPTQP